MGNQQFLQMWSQQWLLSSYWLVITQQLNGTSPINTVSFAYSVEMQTQEQQDMFHSKKRLYDRYKENALTCLQVS